jgi:hypothetical protein
VFSLQFQVFRNGPTKCAVHFRASVVECGAVRRFGVAADGWDSHPYLGYFAASIRPPPSYPVIE